MRGHKGGGGAKTANGPHTGRGTRNAGQKRIPAAHADPATMKPAKNITKKAGPSAGSANEKSRPHRSQCERKARNPRNRWPSPQRGQRPMSPAATGKGGVSA